MFNAQPSPSKNPTVHCSAKLTKFDLGEQLINLPVGVLGIIRPKKT
jgi:hypothetical protein